MSKLPEDKDEERLDRFVMSTIATSLLDRVRLQEPKAWRRLVELYTPLLYYWCRNWGVPHSDEDDLIQEVFMQVARKVVDFRREKPSDSFRGWIRTITHHRVIDYFRKRKRDQKKWGQLSEIPDSALPAAPVMSMDGQELMLLFRRAMKLISEDFEPRTLKIFEALTLDGKTPREIADEVDLSVASIYQIKYRVSRRLKQELDQLIE